MFSTSVDDYNYGSPNAGHNNISRSYKENSIDTEPLSYNSRPRNKTDYTRWETFCKNMKIHISDLTKIKEENCLWNFICILDTSTTLHFESSTFALCVILKYPPFNINIIVNFVQCIHLG